MQRLERRRVRLHRKLHGGERRRGGRVGEVRRPAQPQRLHRVGLRATAFHRPLVQLLGPFGALRRCPATELGLEQRLAAVANATERVDDHRGSDPFGMRGEQVQQEVAAPGVPDHDGAVPAQAVKHRHHVLNLGGNIEGCARGRRRQAALLVGGHLVAVAELVH